MKLLSWNVNGLRAVHRKGDWDQFLKKTDFDVLCLQETKAEKEQLPKDVANPDGLFAYFASSKTKKGYSGVALYSKVEPEKVEYGMGKKKFDDEGRVIVGHYKDFVIFGVYFPNGGGGPERLEYKLDFYDAFLEKIEKLRKTGKKIIFCGDVNTAHEEIDLARPKANEKNTGFLPEERAWLDEVVASGYIDTFRHFYPEKKDQYSYWDMKTRARERNVGWRIDYQMITPGLKNQVRSVDIYKGERFSDHAPLIVEYQR